jgi:hypothetical protein
MLRALATGTHRVSGRPLQPPLRAIRVAVACSLGVASLALVLPARAAPGDAEAKQGLAAAKKGDCVTAVPLLEEAELTRHRPSTAVALAGCYVSLGELLRATELLHAVAEEQEDRSWTRADREAARQAPGKAKEVDARIPTLQIRIAESYPGLEVEIDGRPVSDPDKPRQVTPDLGVTVVVRANSRRRFTDKVVLAEGERRVLSVRLEALGGPLSAVPTDRPGKDEATPEEPDPKKKRSESWVGGHLRGIIIPKFLMNAFGEGGTTVFAPGGVITYTTPASDTDIVLGFGFTSYGMGPTPFKPKGAPATDWEILESDMLAIYATVDLMWSVPLDKKEKWLFRFGGGVGLGWSFAGDVTRTQAYPPKGTDSPDQLQACNGPNNPAGTYEYCNQLDKDADHYGGYAEPSWFSGGARPVIYPWLALPQLGLTYHSSKTVAVDFDAGLSLSGILTSVGVRFGL